MGQEASLHMGRCCAAEEIEEVKKMDNAQTLSFEATTQDGSSPNGRPSMHNTTKSSTTGIGRSESGVSGLVNDFNLGSKLKKAQMTMEEAAIRIQAAIKGVWTRRLIRDKKTDQTLNSISHSFATTSILGERRLELVRKHVLPDGALYSG